MISQDRDFGPFESQLFTFNNQLYLVYSMYNQNSDSIYLFYSTINFESFALEKKTQLATIPIDKVWKDKINTSSFFMNNLRLMYNEYSGRVALLAQCKDYFFSCFLNQDNSISDKIFLKISKNSEVLVSMLFIDDKGNRYISYTNTELSLEKREISMFIIDKTGKLTDKKVEFDRKDIYPSYIVFYESTTSHKVFFYCEYYSNEKAEGIALCKFDDNNFNIEKVDFMPYTENIITAMTNSGWSEKNKKTNKFSWPGLEFGVCENKNGDLIFYSIPEYQKLESELGSDGRYNYRQLTHIAPIVQLYKSNQKYNYSIIPRNQSYTGTYIIVRAFDDKVIYINDEDAKYVTSMIEDKNLRKNMSYEALIARHVNFEGEVIKKEIIGSIAPCDYPHRLKWGWWIDKNKYKIPVADYDRTHKIGLVEFKE